MELTIDKLGPSIQKKIDESNIIDVQDRATVRKNLQQFERLYEQELNAGNLTPVEYTLTHKFSEIHPVFGCAMYARELSMPKGTIIIGKIHKYPVMNILLKGKIAVVSEVGKVVLEAPATYMSAPGEKRVGYVLEDCSWLNVLMTDKVGEENIDAILDFHTTNSYDDLDDKTSDIFDKIVQGGK